MAEDNNKTTAEKITLVSQDAIDLWLAGKEVWNEWVKQNPMANISFTGVDVTSHLKYLEINTISFSGFTFPNGNVDFSRVSFGDGDVDYSGTAFGAPPPISSRLRRQESRPISSRLRRQESRPVSSRLRRQESRAIKNWIPAFAGMTA